MEAPKPPDGYESHSESEYYDFESESETETECDWRDPVEGGYYDDYGEIPLGTSSATTTRTSRRESFATANSHATTVGRATTGTDGGEGRKREEVYAWISSDVPDHPEEDQGSETETEEVYLDVDSVAYVSESEPDQEEDDSDDAQSVIYTPTKTRFSASQFESAPQPPTQQRTLSPDLLSSSGSEYSLSSLEDDEDWEAEVMAEMDEDGYESDQTAILAPLPRQRLSTIADAYAFHQREPRTYEVSVQPIPVSSPIPEFDFPLLSLEDLDSLRALAGTARDYDDSEFGEEDTPPSTPGMAPLKTNGLKEVPPMPLSDEEFQRHRALLRRRLSGVKTNQETYFFSNLANLSLLQSSLLSGLPIVGGFLGESTAVAGMLVEWSARIREYMAEHPYLTALQIMSLVGAVLPESVCPILFWALGFGRGGPVQGTLSGLWQSTMGGSVPSGSIFSAFQSAAMGGKGLGTVHELVKTAALGLGVASGGVGIIKGELDKLEKSEREEKGNGNGKGKMEVRVEEREVEEEDVEGVEEEEKRWNMWESFWW
ncbi:hypothetical protein BJ508DRAFT_78939 [Ascobolus immersus RN42]|uniref:Uncharacterized protein n=1 Tax=Ascobolus immersus RN42 TaxID=1160509 RepID=A0A3N4HCX3_ASCIM|nr:hypothetical protein BJ508DRAFT_78939 [Ascobolus immersus RN42]